MMEAYNRGDETDIIWYTCIAHHCCTWVEHMESSLPCVDLIQYIHTCKPEIPDQVKGKTPDLTALHRGDYNSIEFERTLKCSRSKKVVTTTREGRLT